MWQMEVGFGVSLPGAVSSGGVWSGEFRQICSGWLVESRFGRVCFGRVWWGSVRSPAVWPIRSGPFSSGTARQGAVRQGWVGCGVADAASQVLVRGVGCALAGSGSVWPIRSGQVRHGSARRGTVGSGVVCQVTVCCGVSAVWQIWRCVLCSGWDVVSRGLTLFGAVGRGRVWPTRSGKIMCG